MTDLPLWADRELSAMLPDWRKQGEGQFMEYKQELPANNHRISKDVAAFASQGKGIILVGVTKSGGLQGLRDSEAELDEVMERIQGVLQNGVKPPVKATISLAYEDGHAVAVIQIGKQTEPVFYSQDVPYVRDARTSRPARPDEVKDLVWKHPSSEAQRERERMELERSRRMMDIGFGTLR